MGFFESIKSARNAAQKKLDTLREQMDVAMRKRDDLIAAPAPKVDVQMIVSERIAAAAAGYSDGMQGQLRALLGPADNLRVPSTIARFSVIGVGRSPGDAVSVAQLEQVLAALFPDDLKRAIEASIEAMPWPNDGLPLDKRPSAIAELTKTVEGLRAELDALRKDAQDAGVDLD